MDYKTKRAVVSQMREWNNPPLLTIGRIAYWTALMAVQFAWYRMGHHGAHYPDGITGNPDDFWLLALLECLSILLLVFEAILFMAWFEKALLFFKPVDK